MKTSLKKAVKDESGKVLILALIVLVVGGLLLGPLLGLMGTGLMAGQVYERKTAELYAADAGVEDAVWRLPQLHRQPDVFFPYSYPPHTHEPWMGGSDEFWLNGKSVSVVIDRTQVGETPCHRIFEYVINSTATADGRRTEIVALLTGAPVFNDYSAITDHILVAQEGDLEEIKKKVVLDHPEENHPYPRYPEEFWPTDGELEDFYGEDVDGVTWISLDTTIDLNGKSLPAGPIRINGEDFYSQVGLGPIKILGDVAIGNSENPPKGDPEPVLRLDGTLYISGDTLIKSSKDMTIDLRGNTVFISSPLNNPKNALEIGSGVRILGPGAIVVVGNIKLEPNRAIGTPEGPVFIISVSGTTDIRPGATVYGAIAGKVDVEMQSGNKPKVTYPQGGFPENLNFPGFERPAEGAPLYSVVSWTVGPA